MVTSVYKQLVVIVISICKQLLVMIRSVDFLVYIYIQLTIIFIFYL